MMKREKLNLTYDAVLKTIVSNDQDVRSQQALRSLLRAILNEKASFTKIQNHEMPVEFRNQIHPRMDIEMQVINDEK